MRGSRRASGTTCPRIIGACTLPLLAQSVPSLSVGFRGIPADVRAARHLVTASGRVGATKRKGNRIHNLGDPRHHGGMRFAESLGPAHGHPRAAGGEGWSRKTADSGLARRPCRLPTCGGSASSRPASAGGPATAQRQHLSNQRAPAVAWPHLPQFLSVPGVVT